MSEKRYEAICFDFDGVLADTEPLHWAAWSEALRPLGIQLDWQTFERNCIGIPDRIVAEFFCTLSNPPARFEDVWAEKPRKNKLFLEKLEARVPFADGLATFLNSLSDYRLAVVSASTRAEIDGALAAAGLRSLFQTIVCAEDVRQSKPSPEPYLEAARRLGVTRALAVEDSEAGIQSAQAAGFEVVRVPRPSETIAKVTEHLSSFR